MSYPYPSTPPYILEDRTGLITATDFDDLYDRIFFRIARVPNQTTTHIYPMKIRASRHRDGQPFNQQPVVILDFAPDERLGNITYVQSSSNYVVPMHRYLRKTSLFGSSLLRKFVASDGKEYIWAHRVVEGHEWTCTTAVENVTAAHFELKPPDRLSYDPLVSGNYLTVYEPFFHLTLEILSSLTIMRHISQHNL